MVLSCFGEKNRGLEPRIRNIILLCSYINYLINDDDDDDSNGCTPCTSDPVVDEFSLLCVSETLEIIK